MSWKMVRFSDIEDAFLFVSSEGYGMNTDILCKDMGQIYYRSASKALDEIDDDIGCNTFIEIPHKNELWTSAGSLSLSLSGRIWKTKQPCSANFRAYWSLLKV
jgi:hypothetical protein